MKKQFTLILFIMFLVVQTVFADKLTVQAQTLDTGIVIAYPQYPYITQNLPFELNVHTYNSSNGVYLTNKTVDCYLHIYRTTGFHVFNEEMDYNTLDNEFYSQLNSSVFSELGIHSFIIQCNTTNEAGFVNGIFEVVPYATSAGVDHSQFLGIFILLGIFTVALLVIVALSKDTIIRIASGLLLSFMLLADTFISYLVAYRSTAYGLASSILPFYNYSIWIFRFSLMMTMFYTMYKIFDYLNNIKLGKKRKSQERLS